MARSADAVAGVEDDLHAAGEGERRGDLVDVGGQDVRRGDGAFAGFESLCGEDAVDLLDRGAVDGALAEHRFEAVVIGGIVGAGDHDAGLGAQMVDRVVEQRRGHDADVGHLAAG